MSTIMDTAVRKATRLDYQPPKVKHLTTLNAWTYQYPASVGDIVDVLEKRLRENSWIVTFKVLIILHTLMREGNGDRVITCVDARPSALDTSRLREKSSGTAHIQNIYVYSAYLQQKIMAFRELGVDHVKSTMSNKTGRLRRMTIDQGLLKETVLVQKLIGSLLKCNFHFDEGENGIGLHAYRLLVEDMLVLFQTVNEAIVNILEHYFAMPKMDARLSLEVYKRFARQTEQIVNFLGRAKILERELGITIPIARHAPLSLASALAEYLKDAEDRPTSVASTPLKQDQPVQHQQQSPAVTQPPSSNSTTSMFVQQQQQPQQKPKELIDFFASLDNETVSMGAPTTQSTHNPFRNTTMLPLTPPQQQTSLVAPAPMTPSISTGVAQHNPFRIVPQSSSSTPTTAFSNTPLQQQQPPFISTSFTSATPTTPIPIGIHFTGQSAAVSSPNKFNPFAASPSTAPPQQSNPFATMF
ncbi:ANTH-domain-containing protein [Lichtheimia hyalospora FSU 10163]|nr:ANTH-domain-containing protein [Lichtheimia hyalospora FSU 10163]